MPRYQYIVETLSPIHIGTGETMLPIEFQISKDARQMFVPELDRVFSKYPREVDHFSRQLKNLQPNKISTTTLDELLKIEIDKDDEVLKYKTYRPEKENNYGKFGLDKLKYQLSHQSNSNRAIEVRLATKTPDYKVYIPATSIKGALRTAWAYANVDESLLRKIEESASRNPEEASRYIQDIFQGKERQANYDLFRVLQLSDTEAKLAQEVLYVVAIRVLSAGVKSSDQMAGAKWKNYWIFCEAIAIKRKYEGTLFFQDELLKNDIASKALGWKESQKKFTLEALCKAVNDFSQKVCEWESRYFSRIQNKPDNPDNVELKSILKFYEELKKDIQKADKNTCFLSIGYGSGWHKMTVGMLLEEKSKRFAETRRALKLADRYLDFEYPKSRKLIMISDTKAYPLGWIKLQFNQLK
ncbi:MAG: type III-A CRISPR-associated RAMP protein Csm5 [Acidobacteriota bacterium]|nr:type III-A CRISPR-associated RAMP protein Csm5 [Blastocatellia bacterium]MDW8412375.1 type III-A CRISPR-associated RAMP protein Csm5 [Acidobacteriota bacterium]